MKTIITVLVFLAISPLVFAQDKDPSKYYYIGTIGDQTIQMELQLEDTNLRGSFYYADGDSKDGARRSVIGTLDPKESNIKLIVKGEGGDTKKGVSVSKEEAGIDAKYIPIPDGIGAYIEGAYTEKKGSIRLPINLTKVANYEFFKIKQGNFSEAEWSYPKLISQNEVIQKITGKLSERMKPALQEYQKDAKEGFMSDVITSTWLFTYDYSIEYYSQELISFTGLVYSYTGGAHGNTYFVSSNYAVSNEESRLLKLADLFKKDSGYVKVLSDLIIKDLKRQKAGWVVAGEIKSLKEDEIGPFALSPAGIQFAFAPYAVGSYAEGAYFVTINYESISSVIDPQGPLSKFIKSEDTQTIQ